MTQSQVWVPVITIDGPTGSGKGTQSLRLADLLGWNFLDSGALYRVLALYALDQGIGAEDTLTLGRLAEKLPVRFSGEGAQVRVWLQDHDVSSQIREEAIGEMASKLAALASVRSALLERQRAFRMSPGLVADGRDMGTVIFPDAALKIFLTAPALERAKRRVAQLNAQGIDANLDRVLAELEVRDARDKNRQVAPLRPAGDAVVLDTEGLLVDQTFAAIAKEVLVVFPEYRAVLSNWV